MEIVENTNETSVVPIAEVLPAKRPVGRPRTKMTLKRVVLKDGKPVGRGKPSLEGKGSRTVVFIPVTETYDVTVHGTGVKYRAARCKTPIKRVPLATFRQLVNTPATPAPKRVRKPKAKSVTTPAIDVSVSPAPVELALLTTALATV